MKRTNKYLSLALAIIMALSLCVTSFAAKITVENTISGELYEAYKIFDVTNSGDAFAYSITSGSDWYEAVVAYDAAKDTLTLTETSTAGTYFVTVTEKFDAADFAAHLATYADDITADASQTAAGKTVEFADLAAGYWFIDTSLGSLCALQTNASEVVAKEKNEIPTIEKFVQEDSTGAWGEWATADIIDTVKFKLSTAVTTGNDQDFLITDEIPEGMDYSDVVVTIGGKVVEIEAVAVDGGFKVTIPAATIKTLKAGTEIVVEYNATFNEKAVIEGVGNRNTATLNYSGNTSSDFATVYTLEMDVFKFTMEKEKKVPLANAEFVLMNNAGEYAVAEFENGVYTLVGWTTVLNEEEPEENVPAEQAEGDEEVLVATKFVSPANGEFQIQGLDADKYVLEEVKAPAGYNLLTEQIRFVVDMEYRSANEQVYHLRTNADDIERIEVENNTGAILPGTGGVGTTMFYVLGSVMMIGAAILLVTKKKMANEQ